MYYFILNFYQIIALYTKDFNLHVSEKHVYYYMHNHQNYLDKNLSCPFIWFALSTQNLHQIQQLCRCLSLQYAF